MRRGHNYKSQEILEDMLSDAGIYSNDEDLENTGKLSFVKLCNLMGVTE